MNLKHKSDINAMGQCLLLDKERGILGTLEVGQAVVKLQGRIARPFQITIPEFIIEKGKISDALIKQHMQNIAPAEPEEDFRLPNQVTVEVAKKLKSIDDSVLAFLKDIQQHPDSGIAERYKRLEISVRQGQKLKIKTLEKGLVEESTRTIKTGRLKVIQLTQKGRAALSEIDNSS
jgi:hypothetical protein